MKKLSPKHKEFVRQYFLCGRNASEAYRKTYPNSKTADVSSAALMVNHGIQAEISKLELKAEKKFEVKFDSIIEELTHTEFGSIEDILDWSDEDVKLIPKANMKKSHMKFIDSISFERRLVPSGEFNDLGQEIKTPETKIKVSTLAREKVRAADLLAKLLGYDKIEKESESQYKKVFHDAIAKMKTKK
jgi:phage terminase small subunit